MKSGSGICVEKEMQNDQGKSCHCNSRGERLQWLDPKMIMVKVGRGGQILDLFQDLLMNWIEGLRQDEKRRGIKEDSKDCVLSKS